MTLAQISSAVRACARVALWSVSLACASSARLGAQAPAPTSASEDLERRQIGSVGSTLVGVGGCVDQFLIRDRVMPLNYIAEIDVGRFVAPRLVLHGGLRGAGSAIQLLATAFGASRAAAQDVPAPTGATDPPSVCGQPITVPQQVPPVESGPVVLTLAICFPTQGNVSAVEPETYLHHIQLRPSRPSANDWVPYDEAVMETARADFKRLWDTGFLDDITIEAVGCSCGCP